MNPAINPTLSSAPKMGIWIPCELTYTTVNVDIFVCINFREFTKIGNFVCIKICILSITGSLG